MGKGNKLSSRRRSHSRSSMGRNGSGSSSSRRGRDGSRVRSSENGRGTVRSFVSSRSGEYRRRRHRSRSFYSSYDRHAKRYREERSRTQYYNSRRRRDLRSTSSSSRNSDTEYERTRRGRSESLATKRRSRYTPPPSVNGDKGSAPILPPSSLNAAIDDFAKKVTGDTQCLLSNKDSGSHTTGETYADPSNLTIFTLEVKQVRVCLNGYRYL
ncbi:hypothetical protein TKK_0017339 [Trichogramma kaykai]